MIRVESVRKTYDAGRVIAVDDVSFEVEPGGSLALVGLSGSGKTTTLRMINGLVRPEAGRILIDGSDIASLDPIALRRRIGYVFQGVGLFPHWTVGQNVGAVLRLIGTDRRKRKHRSEELLELVGLPPSEFFARMPSELSGGQRQRVGVARALAGEPKILLLDEPFGALDPYTRDQLQQEIIDIRARLGVTVVLVTHDIAEAVVLADHVGVMNAGRLVQIGTAEELVKTPADEYVSNLFASPMRQAKRMDALSEGAG